MIRVIETEFLIVKEYFNTGKTLKLHVLSKSNNSLLGMIQWYGAWRKYCFYPDCTTIFDSKCLSELTEVLKQLTDERKNKKISNKYFLYNSNSTHIPLFNFKNHKHKWSDTLDFKGLIWRVEFICKGRSIKSRPIIRLINIYDALGVDRENLMYQYGNNHCGSGSKRDEVGYCLYTYDLIHETDTHFIINSHNVKRTKPHYIAIAKNNLNRTIFRNKIDAFRNFIARNKIDVLIG